MLETSFAWPQRFRVGGQSSPTPSHSFFVDSVGLLIIAELASCAVGADVSNQFLLLQVFEPSTSRLMLQYTISIPYPIERCTLEHWFSKSGSAFH